VLKAPTALSRGLKLMIVFFLAQADMRVPSGFAALGALFAKVKPSYAQAKQLHHRFSGEPSQVAL